MSSRDHILSRINANKPELLDLPNIDDSIFDAGLDITKEFIKKVEIVGGNVIETTSNDNAISQVISLFPDAKVKYSTLDNNENFNTLDLSAIKKSQDLEDLDILILESDLAVAENGAVWISNKQLPMRVLPFITKHLVIIVSKENIVPYMHQAYNKLSETSNDFGVFIAGPSKTADIEQSLVIGAHGALSLTLFLK